MTKKLPIVFFGSGPVAAASLRLLLNDFDVEYVVTKPRPAHHKGAVPVLDICSEFDLPVVTAASKAELSAVVAAQKFQSEVAVLIDFGIIVAQDVIDAFKHGIVNSHFSLLPEWRGADPITFAILSGQEKTGVSLMLLVEAMDEGPVFAQGIYEMPADINGPQLTEDLIHISAGLLRSSLKKYVSGDMKAFQQEHIAEVMGTSPQPTYSRKLTKADGILDFSKPAIELDREIRAFLEWPKSRATVGGHDVIITKAHPADGSGEPGTLMQVKGALGVYTGSGVLMIDELKPAGRGAMSASGFIAGYLQ